MEIENTATGPVNSKKFGILLYKKSSVPRYYEFGPSWAWWIMVAPSVLALTSLATLFVGSLYLDHVKGQGRRQAPEQLQKIQQENELARKELSELQLLNRELQDKLAVAPMTEASVPGAQTAPTEQIQALSLFRASLGDPGPIPPFSIEDAEAVNIPKGINFRFNIVNLSKEAQKLSGHIFVLMKEDNSLHVFPGGSFSENDAQLAFNKGEPFSTTKFRPVEASFPSPARSGKILFKVLIFSRTGNLIHKQAFFQDVKI